MSAKTASLLGATGMTGQWLLQMLLEDPAYETVRVLLRRPMEKTHPRMEVKLVDFSDTESLRLALEGSDTIYCCIGTTQKNVRGDRALYRRIDHDIPVNAARWGKEGGCECFVGISSVGASARSTTFYLKLKGEMENAIQHLGIRSVHFMQPSVLLGNRKEKRTGERIAKAFMKFISPLLIGDLKKYRPIQGKNVAAAMLHVGKQAREGVWRYTYESISSISREAIGQEP